MTFSSSALGILAQAFDRLKLEVGRDASFNYPEAELEAEMMGEKAMLKSQVSDDATCNTSDRF